MRRPDVLFCFLLFSPDLLVGAGLGSGLYATNQHNMQPCSVVHWETSADKRDLARLKRNEMQHGGSALKAQH